MNKGTTQRTAAHMMAVSRVSRPATSGNKNTNATARRQGDQGPSMSMQRPLVGPDKGRG